MARIDINDSWHFVTKDHYRTRGGSVFHNGQGWIAVCGRRARGPLHDLQTAMSAADSLIVEAPKQDTAA